MATAYLSCLMSVFSWTSVWAFCWQSFAVWVFGAVIGLLMPRPKWLSSLSSSYSLFFATPFGNGLRNAALALHGAVILREIWCHFTSAEMFKKFLWACWAWLCGDGFNFQHPGLELEKSESTEVSSRTDDSWYVSEKDLAFFKYHGLGSGELEGAGKWEVIMEHDMPNVLRYTAWRRWLPSGKTEYKSITTCHDATAQEFADMYFDDDYRPSWDSMVVQHEIIEHGDFADRKQVVRWTRRFPFHFLSDREYTIARRSFVADNMFFGVTKGIKHPRMQKESNIVKIDTFYSMWGIKDVACPWGSGKPACETVLLHHEDFKIPENLARFAVRHAMGGFFKKMSQQVPGFVQARRARCSPYEADLQAYGAGFTPNPPFQKLCSTLSASTLSLTSMNSDDQLFSTQSSRIGQSESGADSPKSANRKVRFLTFALASGLAYALGRVTADGMAIQGQSRKDGSSSKKKRSSTRAHPHNIRSHPCL